MRCTKSEEAIKATEALMPGGVSSPIRALKSVDTPAIFMDHGEDSKIYDIGGNECTDRILNWGPPVLGHRDPQATSHLHETIDKGTSPGAPTLLGSKLAQLVINRVSSIEKVRMVSSGTGATLNALGLAHGYTGRNEIVKLEGYYHGYSDSLLIEANSEVTTLGLPGSPSVPEGTTKNTITVPYNDLDALKITFEKFRNDIAGVIVELVAGNMGVAPSIEDFLQGLRDIMTEYGVLLISDEATTGFRVGYHCAQGYSGVTPDLTCLGKVIGGGLPIGAFGDKKEIMDHMTPLGSIYQAGTLPGNPLVMTSGYEVLSQLTPETYECSNTLGDTPENGLERVSTKHNVSIIVDRAGSMIDYFLNEGPTTDFEQASKSDLKLFVEIYREMIRKGVLLPPS